MSGITKKERPKIENGVILSMAFRVEFYSFLCTDKRNNSKTSSVVATTAGWFLLIAICPVWEAKRGTVYTLTQS